MSTDITYIRKFFADQDKILNKQSMLLNEISLQLSIIITLLKSLGGKE